LPIVQIFAIDKGTPRLDGRADDHRVPKRNPGFSANRYGIMEQFEIRLDDGQNAERFYEILSFFRIKRFFDLLGDDDIELA
jgi:hypothetical protein